jgi:hypothetical protein
VKITEQAIAAVQNVPTQQTSEVWSKTAFVHVQRNVAPFLLMEWIDIPNPTTTA